MYLARRRRVIAFASPVRKRIREVVPLCNESRRSNACAPLGDQDFARVIAAAESYLSSRSILSSVMATLGNVVHRGLAMVPEEWREPITARSTRLWCSARCRGREYGRQPRPRLEGLALSRDRYRLWHRRGSRRLSGVAG